MFLLKTKFQNKNFEIYVVDVGEYAVFEVNKYGISHAVDYQTKMNIIKQINLEVL